MEILGSGRPDEGGHRPVADAVAGEHVEMIDDEVDEPAEDVPATARLGAEPLAVACLLLALAALLGVGGFYVSVLLDDGFSPGSSLTRSLRFTSGIWAPGLAALLLALLARRATTPSTHPWVRHVWLGSLIAVSCMLVITGALVAWAETQETPQQF